MKVTSVNVTHYAVVCPMTRYIFKSFIGYETCCYIRARAKRIGKDCACLAGLQTPDTRSLTLANGMNSGQIGGWTGCGPSPQYDKDPKQGVETP